MAKKKTGAPVGRPSDYKPEYCQMLIDHMAKGFSYETFAATIDLCRRSLYDWETRHVEFLHAKKKAFEKAQIYWESIGQQGLWNDPKGQSLNSAVWIFNMKNRFKWSDRNEVIGAIATVGAEADEAKELVNEIKGLLVNGLAERKK